MSFFYSLFPFFATTPQLPGSFFDYTIPGIAIEKEYKAILLVNIASQCGLVEQLKELEEIHAQYQEKGLLVIGVPSSDFLSQEPLSDQEIPKYCHLHYGVTFPIAKKSSLIGDQALPLYQWLSRYEKVKWNYHKYLFDNKGVLVGSFWPHTSPVSSKVKAKIESTLAGS